MNQERRTLRAARSEDEVAEFGAATGTCEKTLRTLLAHLGPWGEALVLVGGLSPRYLVPAPPEGVASHVGTTDLDLVLTLALAAQGPTPYRSLEENLRDIDFQPDPPRADDEGSFRWTRTVDGLRVKLELLAPLAPDAAHLRVRGDIPHAGEALGALRLRGAELAFRDYFTRELEGPIIDGGIRRVRLRVAGLVPFLVLKAHAINERVKAKDSYDVVWTLSSEAGGPAAAAQRALQSPVVGERAVEEAFRHLRFHFQSHESDGPHQYANFLVEGRLDQHAVLRRFAYRALDRFFRAWDAGRVLVPAE